MDEREGFVSLGRRLRHCPSARCVGVKPNWRDYPAEVREIVRDAGVVCYPGPRYAEVLSSLGKRVFPHNYYAFMGNKIRQTCLFQLLGVSHPKTRVYYGRRRGRRIREDFRFPFVGKTPVGSSRGEGVWLIDCGEALESYLDAHNPAYIQEYIPIDRDLRVVLIHGRVVHAYWRIPPPGEFLNNVARGARISFENIPWAALEFARDVVRRCGFEEVGLDVCCVDGKHYVLEANMVYGLEGFRQRGLNIHEIFASLGREGLLRQWTHLADGTNDE